MFAVQLHQDPQISVLRLRIDPDPLDTHQRRLGTEFHLSDDAVPVALRLVRHAVRVLTHTDILDAIVHTDGNRVPLSRQEIFRHVVLMGRGQRHLMPHPLAINEDGGLDMSTLQEERHALSLPILGDVDRTAIPGIADEVLLRRQEEGELDVALPTILFHPRVEVVR